MGAYPLSSARNTMLRRRCGIPGRTGIVAGVSHRQAEKTWDKRIVCARGVGEGVLFVLPSSCSITPPAGEGGALQ